MTKSELLLKLIAQLLKDIEKEDAGELPDELSQEDDDGIDQDDVDNRRKLDPGNADTESQFRKTTYEQPTILTPDLGRAGNYMGIR